MEARTGTGVFSLNVFKAFPGLIGRPRKTFAAFAEQPLSSPSVPLCILALMVLSTVLLVHVDHTLLARFGALWPRMARPGAVLVCIVLCSCAFTLLNAACIHGVASALGGRGRFVAFWAAMVILGSLFQWVALMPHHWMWLKICFEIWHATLIVCAIAAVYALDIGSAAGSLAIAWILEVVFLALVVSSVFVLRISAQRGKSILLPSASMTGALHQPADLNWVVQSLDGTIVPLRNFKGKVIVLNVWATWCAPCRMELPSLQRLSNQFNGAADIVVMAVSHEKLDTVRTYLRKNNFTLPFYVRAAGWPESLAIRAYPTTFIISKNGFVVQREEGARDWDAPDVLLYLKRLASRSTTR